MIAAILFLFGSFAHGNWGVSVSTGAFQGRTSASAIYEFSGAHDVEFGLGQYPFGDQTRWQVNLGYRYSPFHLDWSPFAWRPLAIGLFTFYALDDDYFLVSPGKYPSRDYYEETKLRVGIELATAIYPARRHFRVLFKMVMIDTGVVAFVNNRDDNVEYLLATGISFQYLF